LFVAIFERSIEMKCIDNIDIDKRGKQFLEENKNFRDMFYVRVIGV